MVHPAAAASNSSGSVRRTFPLTMNFMLQAAGSASKAWYSAASHLSCFTSCADHKWVGIESHSAGCLAACDAAAKQ